MLGKLIKSEFRCTWKKVLLMILVVFVTTLLSVAVSINWRPYTPYINLPFSVYLIVYLSYGISVGVLVVGTYFFLCGRFFQTMYADQGYLTHTLPVKPLANLNSRLIVSFIWMMVSLIMVVFSITAFSIGLDGGKSWLTIFDSEVYRALDAELMEAIGWHIPALALLILLAVIVGILDILLAVFAAMSLGQLFSRHKVGASIGCGVGIYLLQQTVSIIVLVAVMRHLFMRYYYIPRDADYIAYAAESAADPGLIPISILWMSVAVCGVFAILEYLVCAFIVNKHVNLD